MKNRIKRYRQMAGMTQSQLAERTGVTVPQVSKWENGHVDIPATRLQEIAAALDTSVDMLLLNDPDLAPPSPDRRPGLNHQGKWVQHVDELPPSNARPVKMEGAPAQRMDENLPIYGSALGAARNIEGEAIEQTTLNRAEVVQYARRPVILDGNAAAYGLYVSGSSMEPRHMDGDLLLVDPTGRFRTGDDVVVYLRPVDPENDDGESARAVLVKRLIRRSSSYIELEQFQPARTFKIEAPDIVRIDRVIPWQELLT